MSDDKWILTHCGDGKLCGNGGAEYPCVRRYRHRRLLTFLWLQGFQATHESMLGESDAIMCMLHLQQMVLKGQWQDANRYLSRFLRRATSVEAMVLSRFFNAFSTLANIVAGKKDELSKQYLDHKRTICQGQIRLRSIRLNVQQASFRRRCRPKKQTRQPKSPAGVAKSYLVRWRRIPASSDPSQETYDQKLTLIKALDRLADILDECLKAGKLEVHPLQTTETKGTISGSSLTCPAIYTGIPSVANAGKLASHVPPTGAPLLQPVFSNLTSGCGNSGIGLMANADAGTDNRRNLGASITPTRGAPS